MDGRYEALEKHLFMGKLDWKEEIARILCAQSRVEGNEDEGFTLTPEEVKQSIEKIKATLPPNAFELVMLLEEHKIGL